jgi:hypothetical protein
MVTSLVCTTYLYGRTECLLLRSDHSCTRQEDVDNDVRKVRIVKNTVINFESACCICSPNRLRCLCEIPVSGLCVVGRREQHILAGRRSRSLGRVETANVIQPCN